MTGDDRLRAELRSLEAAAPSDLPPRTAASRSPQWLRRAAPVAVIVLAGVVIGLSIPAWLEGAGPSGSRVGDLVAVPTRAPGPSGEPELCMQALIQGTLSRHAEYGLAIANGDTTTPVMWPHGYVAREGPDGLELLDAAGAVVAREGDVVQLGGGGGGGMWIACPAPEVIPRELTGQLEGDPSLEGGCIWLRTDTGRRWPIDWPDGYREEFRDGQPVLLQNDEVVAEAGDSVSIRGGAGDFGFACIGFNLYTATEVLGIEAAVPFTERVICRESVINRVDGYATRDEIEDDLAVIEAAIGDQPTYGGVFVSDDEGARSGLEGVLLTTSCDIEWLLPEIEHPDRLRIELVRHTLAYLTTLNDAISQAFVDRDPVTLDIGQVALDVSGNQVRVIFLEDSESGEIVAAGGTPPAFAARFGTDAIVFEVMSRDELPQLMPGRPVESASEFPG